jgi:hypothetical protein
MGSLAPGEERYTVPGGGAIAVQIHVGDRVRLVDVEGLQRCEIVAADAAVSTTAAAASFVMAGLVPAIQCGLPSTRTFGPNDRSIGCPEQVRA